MLRRRHLFACFLLVLLGLAAASSTEIISLRRVVAAAGTDPSTWSNRTLQLDWDSGVTEDAFGVNQWDSILGGGQKLVQTVNANKPSYLSAVIADGSDDFMTLSPAAISNLFSTAYTTVWAVEPLAVTTDSANPYDNDTIVSVQNARFHIYLRSSNKVGVHHYTGAHASAEVSVASVVAKLIIGIRWDGSTIYIKVNDGAWSSASLAALDRLTDPVQIARNWDSAVYTNLKYYHMVWTSDAKTEAEVDDVITFYNGLIAAY